MNKNSTFITVSVILLVLLVSVGVYAIWNNSQKVSVQNTNTTVTSNTPTDTSGNTVPTSQAGAPIVTTDSNTVPYISTVVVKGTVNPNGDPTTYWFEYGLTSSLGTQSAEYLIGSGFTGIYAPAYITGLRSNTNYYFRLSAKNSIGTVSGATYNFKTNTTPIPSGTAPTANTASASNIARTTVNLNGQINPKNLITTYWFEYGLTSNFGTVTSFQTSNTAIPHWLFQLLYQIYNRLPSIISVLMRKINLEQ